MEEQQATSKTKAIVGGLLVAGLALTATVAVAARGPNGGDYGVGGYADVGGYGRKNGHRLHCPSYTGMYHSKGRATCHVAPRRAGVGGTEALSTDGARSDDNDARQRGPTAGHSGPRAGGGSNGPTAQANRAQPVAAPAGQPPATNEQPGVEGADQPKDRRGPKGQTGGGAGNGGHQGQGPKKS